MILFTVKGGYIENILTLEATLGKVQDTTVDKYIARFVKIFPFLIS